MSIQMTQIPQNYSKAVEWIFGAYEDAGVTLQHGFQKDAIQNAVGARKSNKWNNWHCSIYMRKNEKGTFLIVEDSGTVGLTGENYSSQEIQYMINNQTPIDPEQRLARFTSMNNSGGNQTGGGLYGVGKIIYSAASKDYDYFFDSLREDGLYVANRNNKGSVLSKACENDDAKMYIKENTGLLPKTTVGTRVIISNPKDEIIEAITNGELEKDIQETWWLILTRMDDSSYISVNDKKIKLQKTIQYSNTYENPSDELYKTGYRVKHFGIYASDTGENKWKGISYYRKGMKIGEIDINSKDIPEKMKEKYWGYIEVDGSWEEELAKIEDKIHYGVSKGKKLTSAYQYLKNYSTEKLRKLFVEWGYIKDKENEDKKLNEELKQIAEEIQDLFDTLGYENLGKGPQKSDFDVRWQNIQYPKEGTETVTTEDEIKYSIRVTSSYMTKKKFNYSLMVISEKDKSLVYSIEADSFTIESGEVYIKDFTLKINKDTAERYEENRIILKVAVQGSGKEKVKELPFFYDIKKPDNSYRKVILTLCDCKFPIKGSRRVNFNEVLQNIAYHIENKRNNKLKFRLNVSIHNMTDTSNPKILDICFINNEVGPYEDKIVNDVPDIIFDEVTYSKFLQKGELELRARLIAAEDSGEFEKGDKITDYRFKIYLNCDEKNGKMDAFRTETYDKPNDSRRSWNYKMSANDRVIVLNSGHNAYLALKEYSNLQYEYIKEQMLKQYVLLYLADGKYGMFSGPGEVFTELDQIAATERVITKIEEVFYKSLNEGE